MFFGPVQKISRLDRQSKFQMFTHLPVAILEAPKTAAPY